MDPGLSNGVSDVSIRFLVTILDFYIPPSQTIQNYETYHRSHNNPIFKPNFHLWNIFFPTSAKLWLKMRRMSIIWLVLYIFVSSLRLKHRMSLIQRALDSPELVDYFSYPHHGWKVRKKVFRAIWKHKLASNMRKVRNFEMVKSAWERNFLTANIRFFESF